MTIKFKILIPMIVLTILVAVAILGSNIIQFNAYVNASLEERIHSAAEVAVDELETIKTRASAASSSVAGDPEFIKAIESGNRDALIERAKLILTGSGMEFCTIADASGVAIARTHAPEKFGDNVTAMPSVKSALSGKALSAIETGVSVRMSVCAGIPVLDGQGRLLGVVVAGVRLDTETFVDSMKTLLDCEVTVFCGDERISTTVVKDDGTRAVGTQAAENVSKTVLAGNTYIGKAKILGHDAITRYTPISDPDGKVQGMLFVGRYIADEINTIWSFVWTGVLIILILLAISVPIVLLIAGRIVKPINTMVEVAHAMAVGDMGVNIQISTKDEMRELANAFNEMIENTQKQVHIIEAIADGDLTASIENRSDKDVMNHAIKSMLQLNNEVFSQIISSANQVSSGARQMADHSQTLAQGAAEQSSTVEQLSGSIGEVNTETNESAAMAEKAAKLAHTIKDNAQRGSEQMGQMVQAVKEINEASQSINKIIKVIDDIAFQTNILALNAAVEAARAGQHGKGFAVVADEVRSLAAKSADAAKDTGSIIENSIAKAELGARIADATAESLTEIVSGINESGMIVDEIAKASTRQHDFITQINDSINQVAHVIHQNSATAEESAAASEEMSGQAELLQNLVSRFKLS